MQSEEHYTNMWNNALLKFESNAFEYDTLIDDKKDQRFGVTLLAKPSAETKQEIASMLDELNKIEPFQYYHPLEDLHVTMLSIISCYNGFKLSNINVEAYINIIKKSLQNILPFAIRFQGITASPSCIMVQGFADDALNNLRNNLRINFKKTDLETSIDKRYQIQTAHSTVLRFRQPLKNSSAFIEKLKQYRHPSFGVTQVKELKFVFNDWYQRDSDNTTLAGFALPSEYL